MSAMSELEQKAQKVREWTERRNQAIRRARYVDELTLRQIGGATRLSHTAIAKILAK